MKTILGTGAGLFVGLVLGVVLHKRIKNAAKVSMDYISEKTKCAADNLEKSAENDEKEEDFEEVG